MEGAASATAPRSEAFVAAFRAGAGEFATGVTVVIAETAGGTAAGMTLNSFTSVSLDPVLVLVALGRGSRTLEAATGAGRFTISLLERGQRDVALAFAERGAPFPGGQVERSFDGALVVRGCAASLCCVVERVVAAGDHDLVLGQVVSLAHGGGEPLIFYRSRFGGFVGDVDVPVGHPIAIEEGAGW